MSIKIDKSVFTPEERAAYEALIAKATVDPEAAEEEARAEEKIIMPKTKRRPEIEVDYEDEEMMDKSNMDKSCKKSADPAIANALKRLETLEKSNEMRHYTDIAKKYAPLGEDEEDLAQTLYAMAKSSPDTYDAYISVLDKSLDLIEKSGLFAEIGKSGHGAGLAGNTVGKVEAFASDIMKSDNTLTREQALMKAWEDHPELVAAYDAEYRK
jgi:hypothetical protein